MSRSHTNVTIPYAYSTIRTLIDRVEKLQFDLKRMTEERDHLLREMENIPEAIKDWGYVDITSEFTKETVRLVAAPKEQK